MITALDAIVPTLVDRSEPLVLEVAVVPDTSFDP